MAPAAIAIEPSYIAFDERDFQNGGELERRILLLATTRRLIATDTAITILTSHETNAELVRTSYYPYHDRLKELLRRLGLAAVYSANDVRVIVQEVINRSESLEEYLGVDGALYEDDTRIKPDCVQCYADVRLLSMFMEVSGIIAASIAAGSRVGDVLRVACPAAELYNSIEFSGTLLTTEPDLELEAPIEETIHLSKGYKSFVEGLDGLALWQRAENAEGLVFALFVGAVRRQIAAGGLEGLARMPTFSVGSEFAGSLARNQAGGRGLFSQSTYERVVSVVCGELGRAMWRDTKAKNQVVREDGALAWRCHVTTRREALRLMYWTVEGKVEFANVGVKNELVIEEGNGRPLWSQDYLDI